MADSLQAQGKDICTLCSQILTQTKIPLTSDQKLFLETILQQAKNFIQIVEESRQKLAEMRAGIAYYRVGHDILTPLVSVVGYAEILIAGFGGPIHDDHHEIIKKILLKGYGLRDTIDELMIQSKKNTGYSKDSEFVEWNNT